MLLRKIKKNNIEYKYCISITLSLTKVTIYSDYEEVINEIKNYLPNIIDTEFKFERVIYFTIDNLIEQEIRNKCNTKGKLINSKRDLYYKRLVLNDALLLSSNEGYEEHAHSIVLTEDQIYIVGNQESYEIFRTPLRIVREIILRNLENIGGCFTHAASIGTQKGNNGFLLVGDNGSGKSTLMWNILKYSNFLHVTNDRCILLKQNNEVMNYAWPMSIRLGRGTFTADDEKVLQNKSLKRKQPPGLWNQDTSSVKGAIENWSNKEKLEITPKELELFFGIKSISQSKISMIILPKFSINGGPIRIINVNLKEYTNVIRNNIRVPYDEDYLRGFLNIRKVEDNYLERKRDKLIDSLSNIPIYKIEGDPRNITKKTIENITKLL